MRLWGVVSENGIVQMYRGSEERIRWWGAVMAHYPWLPFGSIQDISTNVFTWPSQNWAKLDMQVLREVVPLIFEKENKISHPFILWVSIAKANEICNFLCASCYLMPCNFRIIDFHMVCFMISSNKGTERPHFLRFDHWPLKICW